MTVDWQRSMKDRLLRKKYMGVCRCELSRIRMIMPRFPSTVTVYMVRNRRNRGNWMSGYSEKPTRMKVTVELWFS